MVSVCLSFHSYRYGHDVSVFVIPFLLIGLRYHCICHSISIDRAMMSVCLSFHFCQKGYDIGVFVIPFLSIWPWCQCVCHSIPFLLIGPWCECVFHSIAVKMAMMSVSFSFHCCQKGHDVSGPTWDFSYTSSEVDVNCMQSSISCGGKPMCNLRIVEGIDLSWMAATANFKTSPADSKTKQRHMKWNYSKELDRYQQHKRYQCRY